VKTIDCIVVGAGAVGSAALFHLARRGVKAVGIDRLPPGHDRGSSHGATRIIRLVYMEHPDYVPLLRRAYQLWAELGKLAGRQLYHQTGLLYAGPAEGQVVPALLACAKRHDLALETVSHRDARARFPGFFLPESMTALFEGIAGYLEAAPCVRAHAGQAEALGAELSIGETVLDWSADGSGVMVRTDRDRYSADRLVIAPGAWAGELLRDLGNPFEVRRKELFWFDAPGAEYQAADGCPAFLLETPEGVYYGFPVIDGDGVKVAEHSGGRAVSDPTNLDRFPQPEERDRVDRFITRYLPGVSRTLRRHGVCMYTMTSDEHFIVDRHPGHDNVYIAAGLSGHGFKFTSGLGEILADLVVTGETDRPIEFLRIDRPGLT
jgi:sarcosine oxidase